MKVETPFCPKCGCAPRNVIGTFKVRVGYQMNAQNVLEPTGEKMVLKPVEGTTLTLECGGKHRWDTKEVAE